MISSVYRGLRVLASTRIDIVQGPRVCSCARSLSSAPFFAGNVVIDVSNLKWIGLKGYYYNARWHRLFIVSSKATKQTIFSFPSARFLVRVC